MFDDGLSGPSDETKSATPTKPFPWRTAMSGLLDVLVAIGNAFERAENDPARRVKAAREGSSLGEEELERMVARMEELPFDSRRMQMLEGVCSSPRFKLTALQARALLETFDFDSGRRSASRVLKLCITDEHNVWELDGAFDFGR